MKWVIHKDGNVYKFINGKYNKLTSYSCGGFYPKVGLSKNGKTNHIHIHRLLAKGYIPNPENKPCVNHINGIKTDNRLENLEWVTYRENTNHSFRTGLQKLGNRGGCISAYKTRNGKQSWQCEIMHKGDYFRKRNIDKKILQIWLKEKIAELK